MVEDISSANAFDKLKQGSAIEGQKKKKRKTHKTLDFNDPALFSSDVKGFRRDVAISFRHKVENTEDGTRLVVRDIAHCIHCRMALSFSSGMWACIRHLGSQAFCAEQNGLLK